MDAGQVKAHGRPARSNGKGKGLSKEVVVSPVGKEDLEEFSDWLQKNYEKNGLDPTILTYPTLEVIKATKDGETISYQPFQHVIMLESLAPNPTATDLDKALAIRQMLSVIVFSALKSGVREICFMSSDEETTKLAEKHGFEVVESKVLRLKL